ncbi:MAG TPA: hypothetical protein DCZ10_06880 [Pelotomaculum sp.]|nr:hypothetical protein [Pelotomaculum sp.]
MLPVLKTTVQMFSPQSESQKCWCEFIRPNATLALAGPAPVRRGRLKPHLAGIFMICGTAIAAWATTLMGLIVET